MSVSSCFKHGSLCSLLFCSTSLSPVFADDRASASRFLRTSGSSLIGPSGDTLQLRCVNLDPWLNRPAYLFRAHLTSLLRSPSEVESRLEQLVGRDTAEQFWRDWEAKFITSDDFLQIRSQGFNCVRLPINHRRILTFDSHNRVALNPSRISSVDRAVQYGDQTGVFVFLTLMTTPGGQNRTPIISDVPSTDPTPRLWTGPSRDENQKLTIELWKLLAQRYANSTAVGGLNLLNEPNLPWGTPATMLGSFYSRLISEIRAINRNHLLIVEGGNYSKDATVPGLDLRGNPNLMLGFHAYNIFNPGWANPSDRSFEPFLKTRQKYNIPIWLSEFGEDKLSWIDRVVSLAEKHQVHWAVWPWKRVDLGSGRPVIQTISTSSKWNSLADYLISAPFHKKPTREEALIAMNQMLQAIQTQNTTQNKILLRSLTGCCSYQR